MKWARFSIKEAADVFVIQNQCESKLNKELSITTADFYEKTIYWHNK